MRRVSVLLLLSLSAAFILISVHSQPLPARCPQNMTMENVCRPCPRRCGEELDKGCVICKPPTACYCKKIYVFGFDDIIRRCVLPQDCPKK